MMLKGTAATHPSDPVLAVLIHSRAWPLGLGSPNLPLAALVGEWREGTAFLQTDPSYSTTCQIKSPLIEA